MTEVALTGALWHTWPVTPGGYVEGLLSISELTASLTPGRGIHLTGPAGVGKTRLANELCRAAELAGFSCVRLHATPGVAAIPMGALAPLVPPGWTDQLFAYYGFIRQRLVEQTGGRPAVLLLDDANFCDDTSAVVIGQLLGAADVALITTARDGTHAPNALDQLWRSGGFDTIETPPLDRNGTLKLASEVLDGDLDGESANRLWAITAGNPLFIREVLGSAIRSGQAVRQGSLIELVELPAPSARLIDLVGHRMAGLDDRQQRLVLSIAVGEPLGLGECLDWVNEDHIAELERAGVVRTDSDGLRLSIRLAHPLYGEVLRSASTALDLRTVRAELAERLEGLGARRHYDAMRLATWSLGSGRALDPNVMTKGALTARFAQDFGLARDLAERAWRDEPTYARGTVLADILYELGEPGDILAHLPQWEALAETDDERLAVWMCRAVTLYWRSGDLAGAMAALDDCAGMAPSSVRDEAQAIRATLLAFTGAADAALDLSIGLVDRPPDRVLIQAAMAAANARRLQGRSSEAVEIARRALAAYEDLGEQVNLFTARIMGAASAVALIGQWRFEEGKAAAEHTAILAGHQQDDVGIGMSELVAGWACSFTGPGPESVGQFMIAERKMRSICHPGMARWAAIGQAMVQATSGTLAEAEKAAQRVESYGAHPATLFDAEWVRAQAWIAHRTGNPRQAVALLSEEAEHRRSVGDRQGESTCLHDLLRLHQPDSTLDRLHVLTAEADDPQFALIRDHAVALSDHDAEGLGEVADRYGDLGAILFASEAAAQASALAARHRDNRVATYWGNAADAWRRAYGQAAPDTMPASLAAISLTRRESEVAFMAASGVAARDIGERLFVSHRTVETHLQRIYDKLGIRSRAELRQLMAVSNDDLQHPKPFWPTAERS